MSLPRPAFLQRHRSIAIYVPNLIGYLRIVLTLGALGVGSRAPLACVCAYFLAFVCDELDGRAARAFDQTSTLGAVLDMVTDRVATSCLLALLCAAYPAWQLACVALIALDVFSHWFQMYASLLAGHSSHKEPGSRSWLVAAYYRHRLFMGACCVAAEVLYLSLWLAAQPGWCGWAMLGRGSAAGAAVAAALEGTPLESLGAAAEAGVPALAALAAAAAPLWGVKQLCNVAQLRAAAARLVEHDLSKLDKQY